MKRPSVFIIKKRLVWRLSDFSSIFNLPGISLPEPKFYCKFQIFSSNPKERGDKLFDGYKINPLKNCVTFFGIPKKFLPQLWEAITLVLVRKFSIF